MPYKNPHPLYGIWLGMRGRCMYRWHPSYKNYGGRGIQLCERWMTFQNFVDDIGPRPSPKHSIDRIDNDGDYEPGNCRWATQQEQLRNRRGAVFVTIEGKRHRAIELAEQHGLKTDTIVDRASKGMSFADVVSKRKHVFHEGLSFGGRASGARQQAKTHCAHGHEYDLANTYFTKEGWRNCRQCKNIKMKRRTAAKRARAEIV